MFVVGGPGTGKSQVELFMDSNKPHIMHYMSIFRFSAAPEYY